MGRVIAFFFIIGLQVNFGFAAVRSGGSQTSTTNGGSVDSGSALPQCCAQCLQGPTARCSKGGAGSGSNASRSSGNSCEDPAGLFPGLSPEWILKCSQMDCACKCTGELPDFCDENYNKMLEGFAEEQAKLCRALGGEPKGLSPYGSYLEGIYCDFPQTGQACKDVVGLFNNARESCSYNLGNGPVSMKRPCSGAELRSHFRALIEGTDQFQNGCLSQLQVDNMMKAFCEGCARIGGLSVCGPWSAVIDFNNCRVNAFQTPAVPY